MVEDTETYAKHHLTDTKDNRDLLFERIGICDLVLGDLPNLRWRNVKTKTKILLSEIVFLKIKISGFVTVLPLKK